MKKVFYSLLLVAILQIIISTLAIPEYILPKPSDVVIYFINNFQTLLIDTIYTLSAAFIALIIATILGITIAIAMDLSTTFKSIVNPIVYFSQLIPAIVLAPLLIIWLGFGYITTITLIVIMCAFPIITSTYNGLINIDPDTLFQFKLIKASNYQLYRHLKLPGSINQIFIGLKIATTYSITSALLAEFMGAQHGLGVSVATSLASFNTTNIFCIITITTTFTYLSLKALNKIESRLTKYEKIN
jgi:ABC-type nitrate/sulfonate/bicarbonate transport system permease component